MQQPHHHQHPKSVTSIGEYAFAYCSSLTAITIPEGVTSIGSYAFYSCDRLTAVTLPEGLTSIADKVFSTCRSLTTISLPESVTSIGNYAFFYCNSLTAINIPEGVTSIGSQAFNNCSSLTAITIPEDVTSIGSYAFSGCSSLTTINIPENSQLTSIGFRAFYGCSSLTAITIPKSVTSIGEYAFHKCNNLTAITIPESITKIENYTFAGCSSLSVINILEGITRIGNNAFEGCSSLTTITIPESVTSIWNWVFKDCSSLTTIVLPKGLRDIGSGAFANCAELLDVYSYAEAVPSTMADAFNGSYPEYATLHVSENALNAYQTTAPWSSFGKFEVFEITIENITLNQSTATLTEGETLALTATVTPEDAAGKSISWTSSNPSVATVDNTGKVTAVAPGTATITATANDGSGVSASCKIVVNELILGKCTTPMISYTDGKVVFACDTEGVTFVSETIEDVAGNRNDAEFAILPTYTITAYATKEHYENSDIATFTLCWVPCTEEHNGENNGILTIPAKPVLISTQGGTVTVSGLAAGAEVAAYSTAGTQLAAATATDGTATLATSLEAGSIAIVKVGEHTIKVVMR